MTQQRPEILFLETKLRFDALSLRNVRADRKNEIRKDPSGVAPNGPGSGQAPQTANADKITVHAAAARWLQRRAAHNSGDTATTPKAPLFTGSSSSGLNATKPT